ncbi:MULTISPECIES: hypothetical protein [Pseudomonas]|uniref:hypothetical protein n=1 Tax=Pseudomonas TaxID=286 RepID=UPI001F340DD9|nr:hypothetical protein [Pseudomonas juntendi]MCO7054507.1 hypothetical protein [Pseudomonas juntendi]UJM12389.1 hypothetical protein L1P09_24390 [Pseudomonas juntendi]UXA38624.1 hypothetical protein KZA81_24830 [Pseudomonas juntendi]
MNDEFSVFYVLHDLIPIAVVLGLCCFVVSVHLLIESESKKNFTSKEIKITWILMAVGLLLLISPGVTKKIVFNYFSPESFCKFEKGRDQRLEEHCVFHVKIKKMIEHRSGEQ